MKKYGRSYHLPSSPGTTSDDKIMASLLRLIGQDLVASEKMDGENTTIHAQGVHARSPDSRDHPSRDWLKGFAAGISLQLAPDERIVGENLFARHAIAYDALPSWFLGFAWIRGDVIQPWEATLARFQALGVTPVPEIYRGLWTPKLIEELAAGLDIERQEGFVLRLSAGFTEVEMPLCLGKYVRAGHVQSDQHWMAGPVVPNGLA